jgi:hypothetical protein
MQARSMHGVVTFHHYFRGSPQPARQSNARAVRALIAAGEKTK